MNKTTTLLSQAICLYWLVSITFVLKQFKFVLLQCQELPIKISNKFIIRRWITHSNANKDMISVQHLHLEITWLSWLAFVFYVINIYNVCVYFSCTRTRRFCFIDMSIDMSTFSVLRGKIQPRLFPDSLWY